MVDTRSATPDYTMGFSGPYLRAIRSSTAESNAAYLLPYLRPGQRVLDFGCGPGTISIGLAEAVAPGELHGIDMEVSQIALARSLAEESEHSNATFHVGDVTALPFADGFFDVAHCHNVLMHVPQTHAVLSEVKRVLKPGGILACREMICESSFTHPDFGAIRKSWELFEDLLASDDGHPQMGKEMKGHILAAGFAHVRLTGSLSTYSTPEETGYVVELVNGWLLSPEIADAAIKYGASTMELCDRIRIAYEKWKSHPAAFAAIAYGEMVARKPSSPD